MKFIPVQRKRLRENAFFGGVLATFAQAIRIGASQSLSGLPILAGRGILYVFVLSVLSAFWDVVASEHATGVWSGYLPQSGFALYVGVTEWIVLSVPSIHLRLEDDIRSGAIETHLLRPQPYLPIRVGESIGDMMVRLAVLGGVGTFLLLLSGRSPWVAYEYPYLAILGVLSGTVGILLFALVGLCAFWMRRVLPVFLLVQKITFLLGGLVAPITLYPVWLMKIAQATPFAAHLYMPAMLMMDPSEGWFARAASADLFWIAMLSLVSAALWRLGLKTLLRQGI